MKYKLFEFIALKDDDLDTQVKHDLTFQSKEATILRDLHSYLLALPLAKLETADYQQVFKAIGAKTKYTEGYQRQLMIKIQRIYEEKLYIKEAPIDPLLLAQVFRKNGLTKNYNSLLNSLEASFTQITYRPEDYLNHIKFYREQINRGVFLNQISHQEIKDLTLRLDQKLNEYYLIHKLKNLLSIINIDKTFDASHFYYFEQIKSIIYSEELNHVPLIYLYKHCYLLQVSSAQASYDIVKEILFKEFALMDQNECKDLSALLSNYCIKKINTQHVDFYQELMNLYKFNIAHDLVLENDIIGHSTFRNYIQIALRCEEISWAKAFLQTYQQHLKSAERESTVSICQALISFKEKKYQKTIGALTQVNFHNHQLDILARLLLSRAYYELDESEALGYLIDSFKKYIQRNKKIDPGLIIPCKNFLKLLSALLTLNPRDRAQIAKIEQKILQHTQLAEKQWLTEKIAEYKIA